jgi:hypothetical protein
VTGWQPTGPPLPGGDFGGDIQAGDSWDVRFLNPALPGRVITCWIYPVEGPDLPYLREGEYGVQIMAEHTICEDVTDPGGTEIWSGAVQVTLPVTGDLAIAERITLSIAAGLSKGFPVPSWDGEQWSDWRDRPVWLENGKDDLRR